MPTRAGTHHVPGQPLWIAHGLDPTSAIAGPGRQGRRAPARAGRDLAQGDSGVARLHGPVGLDYEQSGLRNSARTRRPQNLRALGPRAVLPQSFRAGFRFLSGNSPRCTMAVLRRRSSRCHSPGPLPGSQLWPLVPSGSRRSQRQALLFQRLQE